MVSMFPSALHATIAPNTLGNIGAHKLSMDLPTIFCPSSGLQNFRGGIFPSTQASNMAILRSSFVSKISFIIQSTTPKLARNGMAQRQLKRAQLMVVLPTANGRSPQSDTAQRHKLKVAHLMVVYLKVAWHKDKNQKWHS